MGCARLSVPPGANERFSYSQPAVRRALLAVVIGAALAAAVSLSPRVAAFGLRRWRAFVPQEAAHAATAPKAHGPSQKAVDIGHVLRPSDHQLDGGHLDRRRSV